MTVAARREQTGAAVPWVLSAPSPDELREQARQLLGRLGDRPVSPERVGRELADAYRPLRHRAVVIGAEHGELPAGLSALADGTDSAALVRGEVTPGGLAFLFSFQGCQRLGMGSGLYAAYPVFAAAFDAVCAQLDRYLERPLRDVVFAAADSPQAALLDATGWAAPAIFALEVALLRLVTSWGLRPDVLSGGSVGDFAAAHAAGVLSLPDAARMVALRARLMQALPGTGAMAAVRAPREQVLAAVAAAGPGVVVGVVNGPEMFVLSGERDAVAAASAPLAAAGRVVRALRVSHAFHSPMVDPMLADFREVAEGVGYQAPHTALVDSLTGGRPAPDTGRTADFWVRHVREAVRFDGAVRTLEEMGVSTYLEIGPLAMQSVLVRGCLRRRADAEAIPCLRNLRPEPWSVLHAVARAHVRGAGVDWAAALPAR